MSRISLGVAALALLSTFARAADWSWLTQHKQPNTHFGNLALVPYYQFTEAYDSNIYLTPRHPAPSLNLLPLVGSWISKNDLGLEASLPWNHRHDLTTGYNFEANSYSKQPDSNDAIDQKAHLEYSYTGPWGLNFRAGDQYENTTDQAFSELTARVHRWMNLGSTALEYDEPRRHLTAGVEGSEKMDKYLDAHVASQLNRYELIGGAHVGYKIQPKTKVYAAYRRDIIHYTVHRQLPDQDKDNKNQDGLVGVSGELASKVTGRVEGGLNYRAYDEAPIGGSTRVTRNFAGLANLVYLPSRETQVDLLLNRRLEESTSDSNRFYILQSVSLDVRHTLRRKFVLGANLGFELDKYPDLQVNSAGTLATRRDEQYIAGARIAYDIHAWASSALSYSYRHRVSTLADEFSFVDHQAAWDFSVKF